MMLAMKDLECRGKRTRNLICDELALERIEGFLFSLKQLWKIDGLRLHFDNLHRMLYIGD